MRKASQGWKRLLLFSAGLFLAGGVETVRAQSALDGFDPNANGDVRTVRQSDGKILIVGDFTNVTPTTTSTATPPASPAPTSTATATPSATASPTVTATAVTSTPCPTATPPYLRLLCERFDTVTPPALPADWVSSFSAGPANCEPSGTCTQASGWVTTNSMSQTAPNSVFHDAPSCVTDSTLDTPSVFVPPNDYGVNFSFWHNYNLEAGHDGGVLEISINGGPFTDFVAAGGTFSGGYTGTISTGFLSPIAGRQAWTGNSGGFIGVGAHLPPSQHAYNMVLRFRLGTDCSGGAGTGWSIDTFYMYYQAHDCCPTPTATASATATGTPTPTPTPAQVCDLTQGFDAITTLVPDGWLLKNNSQGYGSTSWFQGIPAKFPSQSGASNSYIAADFNNGIYSANLSNWLVTPPLTLQNGAQLSFWTRTVSNVRFPDRLQVRMSTNGASLNVGNTATSVGDFTTLLLDINPTYTLTGYPTTWTNFAVTISGLGTPTEGRLAFRYFVENGGPYGVNSDYIGIDTVRFACNGGLAFHISGTTSYCSNPSLGPIPGVTLTVTGSASNSTQSDSSGNYAFSSLPMGGNYTVTPSKAPLTPGTANINTIDVVAIQRHYLNIGTPLSGCRLTAGDVNGDSVINTVDVVAVQRFYLDMTTGIANVGAYQFSPVSRSYINLVTNQTGQDYNALVFGDVATPFVH